MSLPKTNRIQHLLANWPSGMVATTAWLNSLGISKQLVQKYLDSGWVSALGKGAYCKHGDQSSIWGACFAMQAHLKVPIHIGALSALELKGFFTLCQGYSNTYLHFHRSKKQYSTLV